MQSSKENEIFPSQYCLRALFFLIYKTLKNTIRVYTFFVMFITQTISLAHLHFKSLWGHTVRLVYKRADKHFILSLVSRYSYTWVNWKNDFKQTAFKSCRLIELDRLCERRVCNFISNCSGSNGEHFHHSEIQSKLIIV